MHPSRTPDNTTATATGRVAPPQNFPQHHAYPHTHTHRHAYRHDRAPVEATDRALRNYYLPAFREAVRAGVKTAMRCVRVIGSWEWNKEWGEA